MEFWGIDRSQYSLKQHALQDLLRIGNKDDTQRIASVIPKKPWQPLTKSELEAILAFSKFVGQTNPTNFFLLEEYKEVTRTIFLESPTLQLSASCKSDMSQSDQAYTCPQLEISSHLSYYFASVGDYDTINEFLQKIDSVDSSTNFNGMEDSKFLSFYGSLDGFLKGLSNASNFHTTTRRFYKVIAKFMDLHEPVQVKFDSFSYYDYDLHRMDLYEGIASFISKCAEECDNEDEFKFLAEFSAERIQKLDRVLASQEFSDEDEISLAKSSMHFYLNCLNVCQYHGYVKSDVVYAFVVRQLQDEVNLSIQPVDYTVELAKLCSSLTKQHEKRLIEVLELFPDFLSKLEAHTAFKCASAFADDYRLVHASTASQIRVLYSITNKITSEEVHATIGQKGEQTAMLSIASLLSSLVSFVKSFQLSDLADLSVTVLEQKFGTIHEGVDCQIVDTWALLAPHVSSHKFLEMLELFVNAERRNIPKITKAVRNARVIIAHGSPSSTEYLKHLLNLIVRRDSSSSTSSNRGDVSWVGNLLAPLAVLSSNSTNIDSSSWDLVESFRNAWFNFAMQGITPFSLKDDDLENFKAFAKWTPPLVSEESANHIESDLQLNSVLCRGVPENIMKIQINVLQKTLSNKFTSKLPNDVVKVLFMSTAFLLESLRQQAGSVSKLPRYFEDSEFSSGEGFIQMSYLTRYLCANYVESLGYHPETNLMSTSQELRELLVLACHRVEAVREIAIGIITQIVQACPASLGQHDALFTLLECLTLLDKAVTNSIEDKYSPQSHFTGPLTGITIKFSDNYDARKRCLKEFESNTTVWLKILGSKMREDLRSKVYTYLSRTDTAVGLGRRVALNLLAYDTKDDDFIVEYVLLNTYDHSAKHKPIEYVIDLIRTASNARSLEFAYASAVQHMRQSDYNAVLLAEESVRAPFRIFDEDAISAGLTFWNYTIRHQQSLRSTVISEVIEQAIISVYHRKGLFGQQFDQCLPLYTRMEYAPTDKDAMDQLEHKIHKKFMPHYRLLNGFLKSCMHNSVLLEPHYLTKFLRFHLVWLKGLTRLGSKHVISRVYRLQICNSAIELLQLINFVRPSYPFASRMYVQLEKAIFDAALGWFTRPGPSWAYGSNYNNQRETINELIKFTSWVNIKKGEKWELLRYFLGQEYNRLNIWLDPVNRSQKKANDYEFTVAHLRTAWEIDPKLAVSIGNNWLLQDIKTKQLLIELVRSHPLAVYDVPEALQFYLDSDLDCKMYVSANFNEQNSGVASKQHVSHFVLFWAQVSPIEAINLLSPQTSHRNFVIQYALRALQCHPVTLCFFYVPQLVQELRNDTYGLVEEYILEAGKVSQKFAHQIIWNIMANMYIDDDATIPNPMKPKLDLVLKKMEESFNTQEREYYNKEFKFFGDITGISGTLKPYIKKSKAEKKAIIDQEMAKIEVPEGVYLPSHPDGVVVDIDRKSGKPMQSHAKAPFLAKFKIRIEDESAETTDDDSENSDTVVGKKSVSDSDLAKHNDVWQGAIFKVGDDCRQDVLALQVISVFRSIFDYSGLDVYCFPYKVTATAAGRGVIDVLPNSTSRDMLGREAVNGLMEWFQSKHGGPDSLDFQAARLNFVKSMAAYSVMTYLIQFKDRHNGNIMYDDQGHVIHIDFGFCFDIAPGGVRFEAAPFKLTKEMVQLMGGSNQSIPFRWFEDLCVRVFLASRVFVDEICGVVIPMLQSGLPCFKGNTIKRLRERFVLQKDEAEAASYMRSLISKSYESNYTKGYDEFQRLTNGIPY